MKYGTGIFAVLPMRDALGNAALEVNDERADE